MDPFLGEIAADELSGAVFEHLDQRALRAPAAIDAGDTHHHQVATHHPPHLTAGEKDVGLAASGNHEAITFRMAGNPALDQIHLVEHAVTAGAVFDQLAVPYHGPQAAAQRLTASLVAQIELRTQLLVGQGSGTRRQLLQEVLAAGDRALVPGRLPLGVWICSQVLVGHTA